MIIIRDPGIKKTRPTLSCDCFMINTHPAKSDDNRFPEQEERRKKLARITQPKGIFNRNIEQQKLRETTMDNMHKNVLASTFKETKRSIKRG